MAAESFSRVVVERRRRRALAIRRQAWLSTGRSLDEEDEREPRRWDEEGCVPRRGIADAP
jgi:hypothetical protein